MVATALPAASVIAPASVTFSPNSGTVTETVPARSAAGSVEPAACAMTTFTVPVDVPVALEAAVRVFALVSITTAVAPKAGGVTPVGRATGRLRGAPTDSAIVVPDTLPVRVRDVPSGMPRAPVRNA